MRQPPAAPRDRIPLPTLISFASGSLVATGVTLGLTIYLPRYFSGHVGVSLAAVGAAFTLVRLLDIALDPVLGLLMDRSRTRWGRYRLWLIGGTPVLMAAVYMLFMARPGAGEAYLVFWLLIFYAGTSILMLSHSAWAAALSGNYAERGRIFGAIQLAGLLGSITILTTPMFIGGRGLTEAQTLHAMGWTMIALLPLLTLVTVLSTREPAGVESAVERPTLLEYWSLITRPTMMRLLAADLGLALGPGTLTPIFIFFWRDARGFTIPEANTLLIAFMVAGLLGAPFWGWLGGQIGKHHATMIAAALFAAGNLVITALPSATMMLVAPVMFCLGFFVSGLTLLVRAMVADVADEARLDTGRERSGLLYALVISTQKIGGAISVGITFSILAWIQYDPAGGTTNSAANLHGLVALYTWAPVIFVLLGAACLWGYVLDATRHAQIRAQLDARDSTGMRPVDPRANVAEFD